jgi:protein-tyrosine phosphatase
LIDIHCHILPGLDDGPDDIEESLALARAAVAGGTTTIVATPHIRDDYPFPIELIDERLGEVRAALAEEGIALEVLAGGEVAIDKSADLSDEELAMVALAGGPYLLVESPYGEATDFLEGTLYDLQVRGFRPVLAHPERSPSFQDSPDRLATLVDRGVLTSITAGSMAGQFGRTVRGVALTMLARRLVHDVASDAHSAGRRGPALLPGFESLGKELPGLLSSAGWFTSAAPRMMLGDEPVPAPPELRRRSGLRRWRSARG